MSGRKSRKKSSTTLDGVGTTIGSTQNPVGEMFKPQDLPKELTDGMDVENEVMAAAQIDPAEVILQWVQHQYPTILSKQECEDVLTMQSDRYDKQTFNEIYFGGKLALLAYAMPYFLQRITTKVHMKNNQFLRFIESFVAESTFLSYKNMDQILEGFTKSLTFPVDAQLAGFFVRTPIQLWDQRLKPVYSIPPWEARTQLLDYFVTGNVNFYVLRRNLERGFECFVLFRGTSNEFNGIPQYGRKMSNTQLYRVPQYDPIENKLYPDGSKSVPLFHQNYTDMVQNAMPHILQCLEWLNASSDLCERVVVAGHSMGGAMTLAFCYLLKHHQPKLWDKCQFRSYAAPMSCNDAAVLMMEQWIIDSMTPNKFLEVINTDDFVNIQYLLGGKRGLKQAVHEGTNRVGSWLVSSYWNHHGRADMPIPDVKDEDTVQRMLRIIQLYPEITLSAFMNGALQSQIHNIPDQREAGFRMGQRREEASMWGSPALKATYNGTMKVFFCRRHIQWQSEYIGKSHSNYVDLNMNILWAPLRLYEDNIYKFYAKNGLKQHNELRIVGLFPQDDVKHAEKLIADYHPPKYVPPTLKLYPEMIRMEKERVRKPNIMDYERSRSVGSHSARHHQLKKP